jgi:hypothetical protein
VATEYERSRYEEAAADAWRRANSAGWPSAFTRRCGATQIVARTVAIESGVPYMAPYEVHELFICVREYGHRLTGNHFGYRTEDLFGDRPAHPMTSLEWPVEGPAPVDVNALLDALKPFATSERCTDPQHGDSTWDHVCEYEPNYPTARAAYVAAGGQLDG